MAASSGVATPILHKRTRLDTSAIANMKRMLEKSGQTFNNGVPVQIEVATGFIIECATINSAATAIIAGIATEPGNNLTTSGIAKTLTTGFKVNNQASAVVIPLGAPANDGTLGMVLATESMEFQGTYGDSATAANAVLAQVQVGAIRGLTKDAGNGFWYVDNNITTAAGGACVEIVELVDPVGTLNGKVIFKVTKAAQQLST